jgi:pyruvate ferredoxin oxidoreductase gamma subunit
MKFNKNTFEVIFFARGGQGAKTASELVAHAAVEEGKYVKAFPFYGPERSGAPTRMFLRVSDEPIRTQEPVDDPDVVVVMDDTLLGTQDITKNLDKNESLIINTKKSIDEIRKALPKFEGKVHALDATAIALEVTGNPNPNTVLVGKLISLSEVVSFDAAANIFRGVFTEKIGKELTEKNIAAMQKGFDSL